ncbi:MAG: hypothetical protein AB1505_07505 [Candidatus Latescibacterota bacterium]
MNAALFPVLVLPYLFVIAALLRQLNREREERTAVLEKFEHLALRVRWVLLRQEGGEQWEWERQAWLDHLHEINGLSSVRDVEGAP